MENTTFKFTEVADSPRVAKQGEFVLLSTGSLIECNSENANLPAGRVFSLLVEITALTTHDETKTPFAVFTGLLNQGGRELLRVLVRAETRVSYSDLWRVYGPLGTENLVRNVVDAARSMDLVILTTQLDEQGWISYSLEESYKQWLRANKLLLDEGTGLKSVQTQRASSNGTQVGEVELTPAVTMQEEDHTERYRQAVQQLSKQDLAVLKYLAERSIVCEREVCKSLSIKPLALHRSLESIKQAQGQANCEILTHVDTTLQLCISFGIVAAREGFFDASAGQ